MKKNKSNLLLPLVVILVLIFVLSFVLFRENILDLFQPKNAFTRTEGFPREIESAKKIDRYRGIVKSPEEFKVVIKELFDDENKVALPDVDFATNNLYIVTTELNDTKGYRFKVKEIMLEENGQEYKATLERQRPGKNCVYDAVANVAIDIVKIGKEITDIDANRVDRIIDCK